jgi:hypothetical protein
MVEKEYLLKALADLGHVYEEGEVSVTGFQGHQTPVEVRVPLKNSYDIGFHKVGERYKIVADWWGVSGINKKDFTSALLQRYAYHATLAKLEAQGFTLAKEETGNKGQIRLVLRRMA